MSVILPSTNKTDWSALWRELSERFRSSDKLQGGQAGDRWKRRAERFGPMSKTGANQSDPIMEFVLKSLSPDSTVLDIGTGTGRWAVPMARTVRRVTAIEPSPSMLTRLRANLAAAGMVNVEVIQARWEDVAVKRHDFALCSHAMYSSPDFLGFVRKMDRATAKKCFLVMRVPSRDGIIGELSQRFYGYWHDSPNFIIGYNILCEAGIVANVLVETAIRPWVDDTFEDALLRARRHLRPGEDSHRDAMIRDALVKSLTLKDGKYYWPVDGMRSALVWWDCGKMALGKLDDGLAQIPPIGWNSCNYFGCQINEKLIKESAWDLVTGGMRDAGYRYFENYYAAQDVPPHGCALLKVRGI